jgi:hypothetical protein
VTDWSNLIGGYRIPTRVMRLATCLTFGVEDAHDVAVIGFVHTGETAARQNTARESTENAHHHPLTIKRIRRFKRTPKDRFLKVSCSNRADEASGRTWVITDVGYYQ